MLMHMTNGNKPRNKKKIKDKREMETRRRPQIFPKDSILISGSSNEASSYDSSITSIIILPSGAFPKSRTFYRETLKMIYFGKSKNSVGLKPNAEWKKDAKAPSSYIGILEK
jgi:hypothetical protein